MTTIRSQCVVCKHYQPGDEVDTCAAFPDGVPDDVMWNKLDHQVTIAGDHGVLWSAKNGFRHPLATIEKHGNRPDPSAGGRFTGSDALGPVGSVMSRDKYDALIDKGWKARDAYLSEAWPSEKPANKMVRAVQLTPGMRRPKGAVPLSNIARPPAAQPVTPVMSGSNPPAGSAPTCKVQPGWCLVGGPWAARRISS